MNEYQFRRLPEASPPTFAVYDRETGSKDAAGAGDHDQPFAGFRAYQFSTHQLVRLLRSVAGYWNPGSRRATRWLMCCRVPIQTYCPRLSLKRGQLTWITSF